MIRETHEFMSGDEIRDDRTVRTRDTGYARVVSVSPGGAVQEEEDAIGIGPVAGGCGWTGRGVHRRKRAVVDLSFAL